MAISDQELRDFINAIGETNEQNKETLEKIEGGLSVIADALTGGKGARNNGSGNKSATEQSASTPGSASASEDVADDNPSGGGKGTVLLFEDSQIEKLGESIGRHIANRGGMMGGGGEGGGEGGAAAGGGGSAADAALMAKNVRLISGEMEDLQSSFRDLIKQIDIDLEEYIIRNIQDTLRDFQNTMVRYFSGDYGFEAINNRFESSLDASSRNLGDFTNNLIHDFSLSRDSFSETMRMITDDLSSGGRAFALYDGNMREFASDLQALRRSVGTGMNGMYNTLSLEEQNDFLGRIYQTMAAQGITDRLNSESVQNYARRQYMALEEIAQMTGLTVKELSEMNDAARVTGNELVARGLMSEDQAQLFDAVATQIGGMNSEMLEFLNRGFARGPGAGITAYADDPAALASGMAGMADAISRDIMSGMYDRDEIISRMIDRMEQAPGLDGTPLAAIEGNMASMINSVILAQKENEERQNNYFAAFFRRIQGLANELPGVGLVTEVTSSIFGLLGSISALTTAVSLNTVALIANTPFGRRFTNFLARFGGVGTVGPNGPMPLTFGRILGGLVGVLGKAVLVFGGIVSIGNDIHRMFTDWGNIDWEEIVGRSISTIAKGLLVVVATIGAAFLGIPASIVALIAGGLAALWFGIDAFFDGAATRFVEGVLTSIVRFISEGVRNMIEGVQLMFSDAGPAIMNSMFSLINSMVPDWIKDIGGWVGIGGDREVSESISRETQEINRLVGETRAVRATFERNSIDNGLVAASSAGSNSRVVEALEEANRINRESLEQQHGQNRRLTDISNGVRSTTYDAAAVS